MQPDYIDGFGPCFALLCLVLLIGKGVRSTLRQARSDRKSIRESRALTEAMEMAPLPVPDLSDLRQELDLCVATQDWELLVEGGYVVDWAHR